MPVLNGIHLTEHPPARRADRPRVVLVHGSLDRGTSFARVVRRLTDVDVVTYDRRGYHHSRSARDASGPEQGSSPDEFARHVDDLLEVVGSAGAAVVGHSFGGDVALAAAARSPGRVRAAGAFEPPMPWAKWWPSRARDHATQDRDPARRAEAFFRRVVSDEAWERLPERAREERRADGPALVAELAALRTDHPPFDPAAIVVPVVLGRGGSSVPHHRRAVEALAALVPGAEVYEIAGAGHGAHLSHPDAFALFVRRVIERSGSGGAEAGYGEAREGDDRTRLG